MELKEKNVSIVVIEEPTPTSHSQKKKTDIARRPELDVILVALTWLVLLFHVCKVYSPFRGYMLDYPPGLNNGTIKEDPYMIISAEYIISMFITFMHAWAMPMFFYLSGRGESFIKCQIKSSLHNCSNKMENRHNFISTVAGLNAYYALFRRTEIQFRDERVHRLLVPTPVSYTHLTLPTKA